MRCVPCTTICWMGGPCGCGACGVIVDGDGLSACARAGNGVAASGNSATASATRRSWDGKEGAQVHPAVSWFPPADISCRRRVFASE